MKKIMIILFLSMMPIINVMANENAKKNDIGEKVFHIAVGSNYEMDYYKDGNFFYLGKVIVKPDSYEIKFIDYDIKPDTPIKYTRVFTRYNSPYLVQENFPLKTYREIFEYEKNEFSRVLKRILILEEGIINVDLTGFYSVPKKTSWGAEQYEVSFYDKEKIKYENGRPATEDEKGNFTFTEGFTQKLGSYRMITPEFATQLEKEKRFYIGGWEDIKDHIIWK